MPKWFYLSNGQQVGPVDEAQIRVMVSAGRIGPEELVWAEGMQDWAPAREAARAWGLAPAARVIPTAQALGAPPAQPMQLAYASPVVPEAPRVEQDEGPFLKIGKTFTVPGGNKWAGMALASPKAVYLMKTSRQMSGTAYGVGGIAGVLLHKAFSKPDDVRTCRVGNLPEPVRQTLDRKNKLAAKDAIVLPREAIHFVKAGSINNVLVFNIGPDKFTLDRGLFSGGKVRRFLESNGWTLGHEVTPTASAIHGSSLGRTFEEAEKKKPNTLARVVLAVLGILILVLYIAARVANRL